MGLFDKPVRGLFLLPKTEPSTIARNPTNAENKGFSAENSDALRPKRERKGTEKWWARVVGEGCRLKAGTIKKIAFWRIIQFAP